MGENLTYTSNPKYANCTIDEFKNSDGLTKFNLTLSFASQISDIVLFLKFSIPKHPDDRNYENVLYQTNANTCKLFAGMTANVFARMLLEDLKNYTAFEVKCPLNKVKNFKFKIC